MLIELDWLKEYVEVDLDAGALAHALTMGGLELESLEAVALSDGAKREVLELNVTPNRGYCLSYRGVARETAALLNLPLKLGTPELEKHWGETPVEKAVTVLNQEPELCPRYAAVVIENVTPGPSPKWLADRLTSIGLRPINNIVDITNFVMMEYGQPLHAFDRELLTDKAIVIRRAYNNEAFTSIDGTKMTLNEDALVIADAKRAVALAGIMGGANSEVSNDTRNVVLESACFDPVTVRKGSKKYGLRSDSSYRFERGVDIDGVIEAQARAALLIKELAGGTLCRGRIDVYPKPRAANTVALRVDRVNRVLGTGLTSDTLRGYLDRLGMPWQEKAGDLTVTLPSFRPQLTREIDLIEEIARLHGYDNVAVTSPRAEVCPVRFTRKKEGTRTVKDTLSNLGYAETIHYSFIEENAASDFLPAFGGNGAQTIPISNPLSSEWSTMRSSLLPGLIATAARNVSKGQKPVRIFEVGEVFYRSGKNGPAVETTCIAALLSGQHEARLWKDPAKHYDYFDLKGALETLMAQFKERLEFADAKRPFLSAGKSVDLKLNGDTVGYLGELSPQWGRKFGLEQPALVFEIDFDAMVAKLPGPPRFEPIPKFPGAYRDISVLVDRSVPSKAVQDLIAQTSAPLLESVDLYDHFEGKKIAEGKKSLTFALRFQSQEKTLTDDEVNPVFEKIVQALSEKLGASLRQ